VVSGRLARLLRLGLPVALIIATVVAALGLGGIVLSGPHPPRPDPAVALDLGATDAPLVGQDVTPADPLPRASCARLEPGCAAGAAGPVRPSAPPAGSQANCCP
jgi:hypothetical protein